MMSDRRYPTRYCVFQNAVHDITYGLFEQDGCCTAQGEKMSSIEEAVNRKQKSLKVLHPVRDEGFKEVGTLVGLLIYGLGVNLFLRPLHLYSGGFMGFSQLIVTVLRDYMGLNIGKIDLSGIIYYILNIPGLILAFKYMPKRFFFRTIYTVTCMTLILTIIPIPRSPMLDEKIANCLVAGLLAGVGIGLVLRMGACDGGTDLIGMLLVQKKGFTSVGRLSILTNFVLYGICLILFDIPTVIFSLAYSMVCSLMCDKMHLQNINVQMMIVTKLTDIEPMEIELMGRTHHGVTYWDTVGAYTGSKERILMMIVSKYEVAEIKAIVNSFDPSAFVIINEGIDIEGKFLKKLV